MDSVGHLELQDHLETWVGLKSYHNQILLPGKNVKLSSSNEKIWTVKSKSMKHHQHYTIICGYVNNFVSSVYINAIPSSVVSPFRSCFSRTTFYYFDISAFDIIANDLVGSCSTAG